MIDYAYDRFGRTTQDGELNYGYDANGNVTTIGYPDQVTATYTHDFADRQEALTVTRPAGTLPAEVTPVVTSATYLPSGPLTALSFGSGTVESHGYDTRYLPAAIALDAAEDRTWIYTNDDVGNVTEIMAMAACAGNVVLSNHTVVGGEEIFESCAELEAGPDFTVEAGGEAVLRAATRVVLKNGFRVESGGRLLVETDPTLSGNVTKTYGYQDVDYFLTSADGPWGSQSWTYDKIGDRVTETRDGATDTYHYTLNGTGGNTARLASIDLSTLGTRTYAYTPAGHVDEVTAGANLVDFAWDDAGRLAASTRPASGDTSPFLYDGRSFLRSAGATTGTVTSTYDSAGLLHALLREPAGGPTRRYSVFYLAGRPVAQLATEAGQPDRWWYLTTDHLGTPLVATDAAEVELWENRFEPFGTDPWTGTSAGALANEMFLRFPGQWEDEVWQDAMLGANGYFNLHRWYVTSTGSYLSQDEGLGRGEPINNPNFYLLPSPPFVYANNSPLLYVDPLGLNLQQAFCNLRYTLIGAAVGGLAGALGGCAVGAVGGAVAAGVGALPGCGATAVVGGGAGAAAGAIGGAITGVLECGCPQYRFRRQDRWTCEAKCHVNNFSGVPGAPQFVTALGGGPSETAACQSAIGAAQQKSPRGTYTRHCRCTRCWKK
jgi:RHS repeat-associated protein